MWTTALLRALYDDVLGIWQTTVQRVGGVGNDVPPWYVSASHQLTKLVARFNSARGSEADFVAGGGWQGADFMRLYTNIPHTPLLTKLDWVVDTAWDRHPSTPVLLVYRDKQVQHEWVTSFDHKHSAQGYTWVGTGLQGVRLGKHKQKGACYMFDRAGAKAVLQLLVCNSYVRLGDSVFQQTVGIPMGINPAVYMANHFLFSYEVSFVEQLAGLVEAHPPNPDGDTYTEAFFADTSQTPAWVGAHVPPHRLGDVARYVWRCFRFTARFVDDFTSGPNRLLPFLWYDSQSIAGGAITGIYPGPEVLELARVPGDIWGYPTLDIRIVSQVVAGRVSSTTHLYDKRRESCYDDISVTGYVHVTSAVSARVGPNVLHGQLFRFSTIILDRSNFVEEAARCIVNLEKRGHVRSSLFKVLRRFLSRHFDTYGDISMDPLWNDVVAAVRDS